MNDESVLKKVVSVSEMAMAVGLSRERFYQLVRQGSFPPPDKDPRTGRPFYSDHKQRLCLEVRQRNCGIDGKPILFNRRRRVGGGSKRMPKREGKGTDVADLVSGLKGLGLITATASLAAETRKLLYPNGTTGVEPGEVLKTVFLEMRRRGNARG